jgi:OTU domain-containing protein 6
MGKGKKKARTPTPPPPEEDDDANDFFASLAAGLVEDEQQSAVSAKQQQEAAADAAAVVAAATEAALAAKKGKAARKRAAKEEAETARRAASDAEVASMPDPRKVEIEQLEAKLAPLSLCILDVPPDGDCLYHSVIDQLGPVGVASGSPAAAAIAATSAAAAPLLSVAGLRSATAETMRLHSEHFMPFVLAEAAAHEEAAGEGSSAEKDSGESAEEGIWRRYLEALEEQHPWGGHPELVALAILLSTHIEVFQAQGSNILIEQPNGAEPLAGEQPLRLSYHRHYYGLGEHYNSVVPAAADLRAVEQ